MALSIANHDEQAQRFLYAMNELKHDRPDIEQSINEGKVDEPLDILEKQMQTLKGQIWPAEPKRNTLNTKAENDLYKGKKDSYKKT